MSRSGDDNFDSDAAFDYFSTVALQIDYELNYRLLPEQVDESGWWLAQVLTAIEIILLFEEHDIGSSVFYFREPTVTKRWRDVFVKIWDGNWPPSKYNPRLLDDYSYRQQHRSAIEAMFNRLDSIAQLWDSVSNNTPRPELSPLLPDYPLPYFSIRRGENQFGRVHFSIEPLTARIIEQMTKDIIYRLSSENRSEAIAFNSASEEIPAAAEVLSFLCEKYHQSPGIKDKYVKNWSETCLEIMREFDNDPNIHWEMDDPRMKIIKATFDRLEAVATKYPSPYDWLE